MKNINFINADPFIIAEISANHNGKLKNVFRLIDLAKSSGANAVKIQTYTPDMMTLKKGKANIKIKSGEWKGFKLWDLYNLGQTKLKWHKKIFQYAKTKKIKLFSTPFSENAVKFLETLKCQAYKISSFEMNDLNLIKSAAQTKKPLIISTGLADFKEISDTVKTARKYGCKDLTLLYCVSNYPSQKKDFNLNNIKFLKKKFNCRVGLSDHSIGSEIAEYSLLLGAKVFEKHIALKNQKKGLDLSFSSKGSEFKKYCKKINDLFNFINNKKIGKNKLEFKNKIFKRSIYAIKNIDKGENLTKENIKTYRPDLGLSAVNYLKIIGKKSPIKIKKYSPLPKNFISLL
jgi:pseudaminic acid synthase